MYDELKPYTDFTNPYTAAVGQYLTSHQHEIAIVVMFAIMLGLAAFTGHCEGWFSSRKRKLLPRGSKMVGQAREAEERVLLSDGILDLLDGLVHKGKFTDQEALKWADRFANLCDLRDLISSKQLTTLQKLRMSNKRRLRNGPAKPVPIPEPKPGPRIQFK
jgi:hypothetical protein